MMMMMSGVFVSRKVFREVSILRRAVLSSPPQTFSVLTATTHNMIHFSLVSSFLLFQWNSAFNQRMLLARFLLEGKREKMYVIYIFSWISLDQGSWIGILIKFLFFYFAVRTPGALNSANRLNYTSHEKEEIMTKELRRKKQKRTRQMCCKGEKRGKKLTQKTDFFVVSNLKLVTFCCCFSQWHHILVSDSLRLQMRNSASFPPLFLFRPVEFDPVEFDPCFKMERIEMSSSSLSFIAYLTTIIVKFFLFPDGHWTPDGIPFMTWTCRLCHWSRSNLNHKTVYDSNLLSTEQVAISLLSFDQFPVKFTFQFHLSRSNRLSTVPKMSRTQTIGGG